MRIIAGHCRGRRLVQIQGQEIRPTSDRVREALFNIIGPWIRDKRVLDLFAGTGAFGLEALSRGAAEAVFVDGAQASCAVIQKNIDLCRMGDRSFILCHSLGQAPLPQALFKTPFDLVFLDPPYRQGLADQVLARPEFLSLVAEDSLIIVEQAHKEPLTVHAGLDIFRQKKYSDTMISFIGKI